MPISWNEIRHNAVAFSKEWAGIASEKSEAKTYWDEFFKVFGIKRRTVASFEEPVKNLSGYKQHKLDVEDPINIRAVELLGELHDAIEAGGYTGHDLERFLVRVLFCLFAEDTGLFPRNSFTLFIENHTKPDGSDLGVQVARLFQVLNTPTDRRQTNLLEELAELPYVNGDLFAESLGFADLNRDMRNRLLACCRFDWARISPAVFGSLFQSVMESKERRQVGAHYTSERDILKLVRSLFLDDLRAEFDSIKELKRDRESRLRAFHDNLGKLTFLDPACGCGNFLVVTYRELRLLEIDVLKILYTGERFLNVNDFSHVDVDAMYGIEINEFPARIAEVALWLVDHQMNQRLSEAFGQYFVRLPLKKSATIRNANALRIDWKDVLPPEKCSYVMGNPPFVGAKYQSSEQRKELEAVAVDVQSSGLLDYVTGWYLIAANYIKGTSISAAFVSTNSISQGEQVGVLWNALFQRGIHIRFAHRTFAWQSEARGKAHVHVVIIGFSEVDSPKKRIVDYETDQETPTVIIAKNIAPYLVEGSDTVILNRTKPLCAVPEVGIGNKPIDDGNYLFTAEERDEFIRKEPKSKSLFRRWLGSAEFLNGWERW